jgi:hypothetical protein
MSGINKLTPMEYYRMHGVSMPVPARAPTWDLGAPPMPYYGNNSNIGHGHGHASSNGHNNGVQHSHNSHGPVESPSAAAPVEAQTVEDDSSAITSTQYRHSPHRFLPCTVRLPPTGGNGSSADTTAQHRHDVDVPVESPPMAEPMETQTVEIDDGAYNSGQHFLALWFHHRRCPPLWFEARLPGSSVSTYSQHHQIPHVPAECISTVCYAEVEVAEAGSSTMGPLARPCQSQQDRAEMLLRDPRHGTLAPKTKRERRNLAKKVKAEAEASNPEPEDEEVAVAEDTREADAAHMQRLIQMLAPHRVYSQPDTEDVCEETNSRVDSFEPDPVAMDHRDYCRS